MQSIITAVDGENDRNMFAKDLQEFLKD